MSEYKFLTCPKCGREPEAFILHSVPNAWPMLYRIECEDCGADAECPIIAHGPTPIWTYIRQWVEVLHGKFLLARLRLFRRLRRSQPKGGFQPVKCGELRDDSCGDST